MLCPYKIRVGTQRCCVLFFVVNFIGYAKSGHGSAVSLRVDIRAVVKYDCAMAYAPLRYDILR